MRATGTFRDVPSGTHAFSWVINPAILERDSANLDLAVTGKWLGEDFSFDSRRMLTAELMVNVRVRSFQPQNCAVRTKKHNTIVANRK
jgi:hypothetical protein